MVASKCRLCLHEKEHLRDLRDHLDKAELLLRVKVIGEYDRLIVTNFLHYVLAARFRSPAQGVVQGM